MYLYAKTLHSFQKPPISNQETFDFLKLPIHSIARVSASYETVSTESTTSIERNIFEEVKIFMVEEALKGYFGC